MKLPQRILASVRGPLVAATLAGCTGGLAPTPIVPEPLAALDPVARAEQLDPVAYDEAAEAARLVSNDRSVGADGARRGRRIAFNEARARAIAAPRVPVNRPPDWGRVRCGRG